MSSSNHACGRRPPIRHQAAPFLLAAAAAAGGFVVDPTLTRRWAALAIISAGPRPAWHEAAPSRRSLAPGQRTTLARDVARCRGGDGGVGARLRGGRMPKLVAAGRPLRLDARRSRALRVWPQRFRFRPCRAPLEVASRPPAAHSAVVGPLAATVGRRRCRRRRRFVVVVIIIDEIRPPPPISFRDRGGMRGGGGRTRRGRAALSMRRGRPRSARPAREADTPRRARRLRRRRGGGRAAGFIGAARRSCPPVAAAAPRRRVVPLRQGPTGRRRGRGPRRAVGDRLLGFLGAAAGGAHPHDPRALLQPSWPAGRRRSPAEARDSYPAPPPSLPSSSFLSFSSSSWSRVVIVGHKHGGGSRRPVPRGAAEVVVRRSADGAQVVTPRCGGVDRGCTFFWLARAVGAGAMAAAIELIVRTIDDRDHACLTPAARRAGRAGRHGGLGRPPLLGPRGLPAGAGGAGGGLADRAAPRARPRRAGAGRVKRAGAPPGRWRGGTMPPARAASTSPDRGPRGACFAAPDVEVPATRRQRTTPLVGGGGGRTAGRCSAGGAPAGVGWRKGAR